MARQAASRAGLTALEVRDEIARGSMTAAQFTRACLDGIAAREPELQAWAHLDPAHAMRQAELADRHRASGRALGSLHGLPVGVKDVIDTRDYPTENGTPLDRGRRPSGDAAVVERLREAGAILLGKTETTELAVFTPGRTRNPHDPERTPGGSSSGSAAAVAAGMVPLALGTQTNGSVIRPASFCGVVGYKPSRGLLSRRGVLKQSALFDTVGIFATCVEDAALLGGALAGYDAGDPGSLLAAPPDLLELTRSAPPFPPRFALVRSPVWDRAEPDTRAGFAELAEALKERLDAVELPPVFAEVHGWHRTIHHADLAMNYARYLERQPEGLSERLREMMADGREVRAVDYARAQAGLAQLDPVLDRLFDDYDAIVTPAARGEAPLGLGSTGDPVFCTMWTYCGLPAVSLPLLAGPNGLPVGVQLVGRRLEDGRLLRTARWLAEFLRGAPER